MAPTLTAVAQSTATGGVPVARVLLTLTWPGVQQATIQRLDPDGVLRNVRNAEPFVFGGSCALFDHEPPLDQSLTYQATSPQGTGTVLTDLFGRTVSNGWGNADTGQAWTVTGTASDYSVGSGAGKQSNGTVNVLRTGQVDAGTSNVDYTVDVSLPVTSAATANITQWICGRLTDLNNYYIAQLTLTTTGTVTLQLSKRVTGSLTAIGSLVQVGSGHVSGDVWRVRLQVNGSTIQAKAWIPATTVEPVSWLTTVTDTSLTSGTQIGLLSRLESGNTNTLPVVVSWDNLTVNSLNPLTVTSSPVTVASGGLAWLSHPGHPRFDAATDITSLDVAFGSRRGQFWPIGASLPITVTDIRGAGQGTVVWQVDTLTQYQRIRSLIADGAVLLMRLPASWSGDTWYITPGDIVESRPNQPIATDNWRRYEMPFVRVDRPAGSADGAVGQTWNDVNSTYANWNAVAATGKTWTALAQSVT